MRWVLSGTFSFFELFDEEAPIRSPVRPPPNGFEVDVDIVEVERDESRQEPRVDLRKSILVLNLTVDKTNLIRRGEGGY